MIIGSGLKAGGWTALRKEISVSSPIYFARCPDLDFNECLNAVPQAARGVVIKQLETQILKCCPRGGMQKFNFYVNCLVLIYEFWILEELLWRPNQ